MTKINNPSDAVYIIAEAGSNFDGKLDQALKLIEIAADAGADAVKFQLFNADILYPDSRHPVHSRVRECELPRVWLKELYAHSSSCGIDFLASPFDAEAIDLLEDVGVNAYKWGSSEVVNHRLLLKAARTGKPVYLSTGMCTMADIAEAIDILDGNGCPSITILHCVAVYPTEYQDAHLRVMSTLEKAFGKPVGFSDHSLGITLPIAATALGAKVIEKHFTLDRSLKGPDHSYALEPDELKEMIKNIRSVEVAMGLPNKGMHLEEKAWGRREGLYARRFIKKGGKISSEDLMIQRPATSLPSRYQNSVIGAILKRDLTEGEPINWDDIE